MLVAELLRDVMLLDDDASRKDEAFVILSRVRKKFGGGTRAPRAHSKRTRGTSVSISREALPIDAFNHEAFLVEVVFVERRPIQTGSADKAEVLIIDVKLLELSAVAFVTSRKRTRKTITILLVAVFALKAA